MSVMNQPDIQVVKSWINLSGTSEPFSLPTGYYRAELHCADSNNPPTLNITTADGLTTIAGPLNTVMSLGNPDFGIAPLNPSPTGVLAFQVRPNMSLVCVVSNAAATSLQIFG